MMMASMFVEKIAGIKSRELEKSSLEDCRGQELIWALSSLFPEVYDSRPWSQIRTLSHRFFKNCATTFQKISETIVCIVLQRDILSQHEFRRFLLQFGKIKEVSRDERFWEVERRRKRLESTALILYLRFKKIRWKNIFSSWRKMILKKKFGEKSEISMFSLSKLIVSLLRAWATESPLRMYLPAGHPAYMRIFFQ